MQTEKYRHDLEVIRDTAGQIIKDFGMSGIQIEFTGSTENAYRELVEQIQPILKKMYRDNPGNFRALLYRIDISENTLNQLLRDSSSEDFTFHLAHTIIERELIKIVYRKLFSRRDG
jgi:hypothetical protein